MNSRKRTTYRISVFVRTVRVQNAQGCARAHSTVITGLFLSRFLQHGAPFHGTNPALSGPDRTMETSEQVSGTILVVDDDEWVRKVLTLLVADMCYAVTSAESAHNALS